MRAVPRAIDQGAAVIPRDVVDGSCMRNAPPAEVRAIGLAGSAASGASEPASDLDLYVFVDAVLADARRAMIEALDPPAADWSRVLGSPEGDEFHEGATGAENDVAYLDPNLFTSRIDAATVRHEADLGCSTCLFVHGGPDARPVRSRRLA